MLAKPAYRGQGTLGAVDKQTAVGVHGALLRGVEVRADKGSVLAVAGPELILAALLGVARILMVKKLAGEQASCNA